MAETAVPIRCTRPQLWLWYENAPSNQPRCRLSTGETCRVVDPWPSAERENVVRGLVPRWGGGGAWQNSRCQFAVPSHISRASYLGVPAPAAMSDCYESMSRTPIWDRLLRQPLIRHSRHPFLNPAPRIRHSREGGNPRTNIPRKNAIRETTTHVHTATPLRLSDKSTPRTPIPGRNPGRGVRAWTIDIHNKTPQSVLFYSENTRSCPSRPTTRSYHCGRDAGKEQLDRPRSRHRHTAGPGRRPQRPPSVEPGKTRRLRDAGPARRGGGLETPPDPHSLRAATANRRTTPSARWPIGSR